MTALQSPPGGGDAARNGLILVAIGVAIGVILMISGSNDDVATAEGTSTTVTSSSTSTLPDETTSTLPGTGITVPPAELALVVANGSTVKGLAANTKEFLSDLGYANIEAMNATPTTVTVVYYLAGSEADASSIATALGLPSTPAPIALLPTPAPVQGAIGDAKVVVVLGSEPPAVVAAVGASGSSTTTASGSTNTTAANGSTNTTIANGSSSTTAANGSTVTSSGSRVTSSVPVGN